MAVAEIARRLKEARLNAGLSQKEVADMLGITYQAISNYERGVNRVDAETLVKLCNIYQIRISNLIPSSASEDVEDNKPRFPFDSIKNIHPMPSTSTIPLIGSIPCGEPTIAIEEADETVELPEMVQADFALRCSGDSMINARIFNGDIVYIRSQPTVDNGEIAAVLIDDEATLKRFYHYSDRIVLEPANPMYDPLVFRGEEMQDVRVLGKAVAFTSLVR